MARTDALDHERERITTSKLTSLSDGVARQFIRAGTTEGLGDARVTRFAEHFLGRISKAVERDFGEDWYAKLSVGAQICIAGYLDTIRAYDVLLCASRSSNRSARVDSVVIKSLANLLKRGMSAGAWKLHDV